MAEMLAQQMPNNFVMVWRASRWQYDGTTRPGENRVAPYGPGKRPAKGQCAMPGLPVTDASRPCERWCPGAKGEGHWRHFDRFRKRKVIDTHGTVCIRFNKYCKQCEQILRVERKNEDRPLSIIHKRAEVRASKLGVSVDFIWRNMNYQSLVAKYRGALLPDALCSNCGHPYESERDIQIEHREPPRFQGDWAREHARNLEFYCGNCNPTKHDKPYSPWLDEQEETRLVNEQQRAEGLGGRPTDEMPGQQRLALFDV